jgi:hypothetical protein
MTTIYITRAESGWHVTFRGGNFTLCVETLKSFLSPHARAYNPTKRAWFIEEDSEARMQKWLAYARTNLGVRVEWVASEAGDEPKRPTKPHAPSKVAAYAALHLLPTAPPEVVRAAYKALAVIAHPDKPAGDTATMQTINEAYRELAA